MLLNNLGILRKPNSLGNDGKLLDVLDGCVMCFSLYQLYSSAKKCLRVRRDSDNAELDIGFVSSYVDYTTIETFVGVGNTGYVSVWYNQYAKGNNAVQLFNSKQPKIALNGVFSTNGVYFDNPSYIDGAIHLTIADYAENMITTPPISMYVNFVPKSSIGYIINRSIGTNDGTVNYGIYYYQNSKVYIGINQELLTLEPNYILVNIDTTGKVLFSHDGAVVKGTSDGVIKSDTLVDTTYTLQLNHMNLGCIDLESTKSFFFNGYIKTALMFNAEMTSRYQELSLYC